MTTHVARGRAQDLSAEKGDRVRAVIFDLGHTIIDFGPAEDALRDTYRRVLATLSETAEARLPGEEAMIEGVTRRIFRDVEESYEREELEELDILALFDTALQDLGLRLDAATVREIAQMEHRALASGEVLPADNVEAIKEVRRRGLKIGLVSNVTLMPDLMREDLERLGLLPYFDVTVFSSEEMVRKPHPRIYQAALARLEVPGSQAVFVGDRLKEDVRGPKDAGMRAVLTTQFRQEDPATAAVQPDAVIARLADLPAALSHMGDLAL
jgi:HAD superfamily hydrolase (TIGR01549 family)